MCHHVDARDWRAIRELLAEEDPERAAEVENRPVVPAVSDADD